ncbi:MAG: type II secretion system F family protein [Thermodesulfobacteriota bacterium]
MGSFKYRVRDKWGRPLSGVIEAPSLEAAGERLWQLGYFPIALKEERREGAPDLGHIWERFQRVKLTDLIFFTQQLSTLYKAGLPLLSGLESILEQTENRKLKTILEKVKRQVEGGSTLSEAMARHSQAFPLVYVNMVRAGETSGMLGEALDRFISLAERELNTKQKVKEATRYPKIIILALSVALVVLMTFVIPRFAQIFAQFKTPLPWPTRLLLSSNEFFQNNWYLILAAGVALLLGLNQFLRTANGRALWDRLKIRLPLLGAIFLKVALSRFAFIFVMLNRSGVPILQTLEIAAATIDNYEISQAIEEIRRKIKTGKNLALAMKETKKFTPLVVQMVSIGESSGTLDGMLLRVSEYYDREIDNAIKKMSTLIEPVLTLGLGVVVMFLALAVFLPWWNMAALFR